MNAYEVILQGFDGNTDARPDDLVKWIIAPNLKVLGTWIADNDLVSHVKKISPMQNHGAFDVVIDGKGGVLFSSSCPPVDQWKSRIQDAATLGKYEFVFECTSRRVLSCRDTQQGAIDRFKSFFGDGAMPEAAVPNADQLMEDADQIESQILVSIWYNNRPLNDAEFEAIRRRLEA